MKKLFLGVLVLIACLGLTACGDKKQEKPKEEAKVEETAPQKQEVKVVFNIMDIANKNKEEVDKVLGEPTSTEESKFRYAGTDKYASGCSKAYYTKEYLEVEVMFIEEVAARITVTPKGDMPYYGDKLLKPIGLDYKTCTSSAAGKYYWKNEYGLYELGVFAEKEGDQIKDQIQYIYAITDEKYK